nr:IS5 family transposase [Hymenobacter roseosalivarius]
MAPGAGPGATRNQLAPPVRGLDYRAGTPGGGRGQKKDSPVGQALGRSRGGFTTKLHLSCDAQGRICALALTGGQAGDCPQAPGLLASHLRAGQAVLADRAYDAGYVRAQIQQAGATAVIPGKKNRIVPLAHDAEIYKERNHIEWAINDLKRFRAVATRFDKRAANYFATCCLIAVLTWLQL